MTSPIFISNVAPITANDDLPRPTASAAFTETTALPQPLSGVSDTGRISFGAACRLPVRK